MPNWKNLTPEQKAVKRAECRVRQSAKILSKLDKSGGPESCWEWTGYIAPSGYGQTWFDGRKTVTHKAVYEIVVGQVPDGLQLDHLCRNRACCNPKHLEPVTQRENLLRGEGLPGKFARRTHCKNGHEFNEENTKVYGNARCCIRCKVSANNRRKERLKAAGYKRVKDRWILASEVTEKK